MNQEMWNAVSIYGRESEGGGEREREQRERENTEELYCMAIYTTI